jgi:hypothetical protein
MAGKREVQTRDRQRNSSARKQTHREGLARQKQQSAVIQKLWTQAKAEAKAQAQA